MARVYGPAIERAGARQQQPSTHHSSDKLRRCIAILSLLVEQLYSYASYMCHGSEQASRPNEILESGAWLLLCEGRLAFRHVRLPIFDIQDVRASL